MKFIKLIACGQQIRNWDKTRIMHIRASRCHTSRQICKKWFPTKKANLKWEQSERQSERGVTHQWQLRPSLCPQAIVVVDKVWKERFDQRIKMTSISEYWLNTGFQREYSNVSQIRTFYVALRKCFSYRAQKNGAKNIVAQRKDNLLGSTTLPADDMSTPPTQWSGRQRVAFDYSII